MQALAFRLGYLPTVAAQALEFFQAIFNFLVLALARRAMGAVFPIVLAAPQDVLPPGTDTPWFEYKRIPLPW